VHSSKKGSSLIPVHLAKTRISSKMAGIHRDDLGAWFYSKVSILLKIVCFASAN
jgi:hypothetical protein